MVYVINKNGNPLMPCSQTKARKLLKQNKAKCIKKIPFTIKLLWDCEENTQNLILGVDTGSTKIGTAVINQKNEVIYISEVEIRNDITEKMKQRSKYRRNRRNRKTRYRKARWLNRKNSIKTDRFSPTMISKFNSHIKEIQFIQKILPINKIIIETGTFDPHALKNPEVLKNKDLYQRGINYGFANTKSYVLTRDNYICQHCKGKSKDKHLNVHHIIFKSKGGSDDEKNLITLCKTCHDKVHNGTIELKKNGKIKGQLNHATQMNSIRIQVMKKILNLKIKVQETFGYITKEYRQLLNLPKEHYIDAVCIASQGNNITFKTNNLLLKKCISDGDYQQTKGIRSEQKIPTGKIQGFRKFDKILYLTKKYFIKGRMSTGYAILMNINGEKIDLKPIPKFNKMERISARKSWIIHQKTIPNIY
jgi:hypothetical protein